MKKLVLLGDSIRLIGYGTVLPDMLKDSFETWQPEENGRFAQFLLRQLFDYADKIDAADIVHFNAGLWDVCDIFGDGTFTPVEVYAGQIARIADILLKKKKTVIFATTTPVREDNPYNRNNEIRRFNTAALAALEGTGVIINDLFSTVMTDVERFIRADDKLHLTDEGLHAAADSTAALLKTL